LLISGRTLAARRRRNTTITIPVPAATDRIFLVIASFQPVTQTVEIPLLKTFVNDTPGPAPLHPARPVPALHHFPGSKACTPEKYPVNPAQYTGITAIIFSLNAVFNHFWK